MFRSLTIALGCACALAAADQQHETDWCTITVPETAKVGEAVTIVVQLKDLPADAAFVAANLMWRDEAGAFKGTNNHGGDPRAAKAKERYEWKIVVKEKAGMGSLIPAVFLSADGTWPKRVANVSQPVIKLP